MKISTYWFCFVIAFAVLCLLPVFYISIQPRSPISLNILASAYFLHTFDESWKTWIFVTHLLVASIIAIVATQIVQGKSERSQTSTRISLRHLLFLTATVAAILAVLSQLNVPTLCRAGLLIPFVCYAVSIYLLGMLGGKSGS